MTTGQMAELKDAMRTQIELTRMMSERLNGLVHSLAEVTEGYKAIDEKIEAMGQHECAREIFKHLVERGTITAEEAEKALAS